MISVVTQGEMFSLGAQLGWEKAKLDRLEELLNELVIVDLKSTSRPLLERYAEIDAYSQRVGQKMGKNDLWIAASAIESGSILLTCDHDFDHLSEKYLKLWWLDPAGNSWPNAPP